MKKEKVINSLNPLFFRGIAHRGLHDKERTENGLNAFLNAIENKIAFELDVHLTKDNKLIVCHDSELKRTTGKEGIIEEMNSKDIIENYHLLDGEKIPTLQDVFKLNKEWKVPIVIELKIYKRNYKPLAKRLMEELEGVDRKNVWLISFDPRSLLPFKGKYLRSLLVAKSSSWVYMFRHFFESVDLDQKMFDSKRIQNYQKKHVVNIWTIENKEEFDRVFKFADTITFQYLDSEYVKEQFEKKNKEILNK